MTVPADQLAEQVRAHYAQVCHCEWTDDEFTRSITSAKCFIHGRVPDPLAALLAALEAAEQERDELLADAAGQDERDRNAAGQFLAQMDMRRAAEARAVSFEKALRDAEPWLRFWISSKR